MHTVQAPTSAPARIEIGTNILDAATTAPKAHAALIKKSLARFSATQKAYVAAQKQVTIASASVHAAEAKVAALDNAQDDAIEALVVALINDKLPRQNPLKGLTSYAASDLKQLRYDTEASECHKLVEAVRKRAGLSKASLAAATKLDAAASAVDKALPALETVKRARTSTETKRDAIGLDWQADFGALKRAAKSAEDNGAPGLFARLFVVEDAPATSAAGPTGPSDPTKPTDPTAPTSAKPKRKTKKKRR